MKLYNIKEVKAFEEVVQKATGSVWIEIKNISDNATILNVDLKSSLSRYVALGKIIEASTYDGCSFYFELFCQHPEDEELFFKFFNKYPDTLKKTINKTETK